MKLIHWVAAKRTTDNILIDEKSKENILIYGISYRNLIDPNAFRFRFDKLGGFVKMYDWSKCLVLLGPEK